MDLTGALRGEEHICVKLARRVHTRHFLELGTFDGQTSMAVFNACDALITTINLPDLDNYRFGTALASDSRILFLRGDSRDPKMQEAVAGRGVPVDLMYVDSDHYADVIREEWRMYEPVLADAAIVVVDDLNHNDMMDFWHEVCHDKLTVGNVGVFRYVRSYK